MARYVVVDFAGHGFQMDLSRALARRGHAVAHTWCSTNLTPHGDLSSGPGVRAVPIATGGTFEKYRLAGRLRSELVYGVRTARLLWSGRPDGVLTSNVPLVSLLCIAIAAKARRLRWVLWLQDVQTGLARQSLSCAVKIVGRALQVLERWLIRSADQVVVIGDDFVPEVCAAGTSAPVVVPNWAVLSDLPVLPKENAWAREHGVDTDRVVFLYAGTLGRKHPPELLTAIADELPDALVVVASEGEGAQWLRHVIAERQLANVVLLPFQPHERMAEMLASADVLVAVLHESAGSFSVPSKVLSYLCAGRTVLAAMPPDNGAARLVAESGCGLTTEPSAGAVREAVRSLACSPDARRDYGSAARKYAEASFDVDAKAEIFDRLLSPSRSGGQT